MDTRYKDRERNEAARAALAARKKKLRARKRRLRRLVLLNVVLLAAVIGMISCIQLTSAPVLKGDPEMTIAKGTRFRDPGAKPAHATSEGEVDTEKEGDYTITYTNHGESVTRTVHVVDLDNIVLGIKGPETQLVREGDPYIEGGAFAISHKSGPLTDEVIDISGDVDTSKPGDYTVTYTLDIGGMTKQKERTVRVLPAKKFKEIDRVPVMMYHWIYNKDEVPENLDGNWILDTDLEEQLKYLKQNDFYFPSWTELRAWIDGDISLPEKSAVLTFDDGTIAFLENGTKLFEKYKIPITSFMICWDDNDAEYKVSTFASEYIDFESHTYAMHQKNTDGIHRGIMITKTKKQLLKDLKKARKVIGNNDALAYPYGEYSDTIVDAVRESGILVAFTTEYDRVQQGMDPYELPRIRVIGDASFETWKDSIS